MNAVIWIKLINEAVPLFLLSGLGFFLYRGFKQNQALFSEREELLKRYLLFRGDKEVRLKIYGEDETVYRELLRNLSNSWKNFKRAYDRCLSSLTQNITKTKRFLQFITLGLLINSGRLFLEEYFFFGLKARFFQILGRELSNYALVMLGFLLLRMQTQRVLSLRGEVGKMDREILFFPSSLSMEGEHEGLYNEFDPLEEREKEDGNEDQDPGE